MAVLPLVSAWSGVGSWSAAADLITADAQGGRIHVKGFHLHASNTFVRTSHRPVVVLGEQDLLMIDTSEALFVVRTSRVEQFKEVVARIDADSISQSAQHRKVARPCCAYDSVDVGERYQVKLITDAPV